MKNLLLIAALTFAVTACGAPPASAPAASIEFRDGWAAVSPGGVDVAAGYLTIINDTGADDRLVGASSPRAARVEIHEMSMDGDIMRMRQVEALAAPAGAEVALAPGGLHLMFVGVTEPFVEGETVPLMLTFENGGAKEVTLTVRGGTAQH